MHAVTATSCVPWPHFPQNFLGPPESSVCTVVTSTLVLITVFLWCSACQPHFVCQPGSHLSEDCNPPGLDSFSYQRPSLDRGHAYTLELELGLKVIQNLRPNQQLPNALEQCRRAACTMLSSLPLSRCSNGVLRATNTLHRAISTACHANMCQIPELERNKQEEKKGGRETLRDLSCPRFHAASTAAAKVTSLSVTQCLNH